MIGNYTVQNTDKVREELHLKDDPVGLQVDRHKNRNTIYEVSVVPPTSQASLPLVVDESVIENLLKTQAIRQK
jgi:hypothetical protein